jgi:hypothetical protein
MRLLRALVAATGGGSACTNSTRLPGYLWLPDADDESFPLFSVDIYGVSSLVMTASLSYAVPNLSSYDSQCHQMVAYKCMSLP